MTHTALTNRLLPVLGLLLAAGLAHAQRLTPYWDYDLADYHQVQVFVPAAAPGGQAAPLADLAREGTAQCWTPASAGSRPELATDGDPETYCAVPPTAANARDLPQDLGVQWDAPRRVSQVRVTYHGPAYMPTPDGVQLQAWDGRAWVALDCRVANTDTPEWVLTCPPVETTRVRVLTTRLAAGGLAIRSLAIFADPVVARQQTTRTARTGLQVIPLATEPGARPRLLALSGAALSCLAGNGRLAWEAQLPAAGVALCPHGTGAAVLGGDAIYGIDGEGGVAWQGALPGGTGDQARLLPGPGGTAVVVDSQVTFIDDRGQIRWRQPVTGGPIVAAAVLPPAGDQPLRVALATAAAVRLLGPDGQELQNLAAPGGDEFTALAAGPGAQWVAATRQGRLLRGAAAPGPTPALPDGFQALSLVTADIAGDEQPELLVTGAGGEILALAADGQTLWQAKLPAAATQLVNIPAERAGLLAVATADGQLHLLGGDGQLVTAYPLGAGVRQLLATDLDGEGTAELVAVTADTRLVAVRLTW